MGARQMAYITLTLLPLSLSSPFIFITSVLRLAAMGPNVDRVAIHTKRAYSAKNAAPPAERRIREIWRRADAICFDVDSTVCRDEAIDELAKFVGKGEEVAACTNRAMNGSMTFREALRMRLDIMRPTLDQMKAYVATHPIQMTPGIIQLISTLHRRGTDVYLVSGGFRALILPVARLLNIPPERVFANELLFDAQGRYIGFDPDELTSDSGSKNTGKAGVCGLLKATYGYKTLVMVGDGATDAEAAPPADAFIGFGGNQVRRNVLDKADWYVYDFQTLIDELRE